MSLLDQVGSNMAIGTGDGKYYETEFDMAADQVDANIKIDTSKIGYPRSEEMLKYEYAPFEWHRKPYPPAGGTGVEQDWEDQSTVTEMDRTIQLGNVYASNQPLARTWKDVVPKFELPPQPKPIEPVKKSDVSEDPVQAGQQYASYLPRKPGQPGYPPTLETLPTRTGGSPSVPSVTPPVRTQQQTQVTPRDLTLSNWDSSIAAARARLSQNRPDLSPNDPIFHYEVGWESGAQDMRNSGRYTEQQITDAINRVRLEHQNRMTDQALRSIEEALRTPPEAPRRDPLEQVPFEFPELPEILHRVPEPRVGTVTRLPRRSWSQYAEPPKTIKLEEREYDERYKSLYIKDPQRQFNFVDEEGRTRGDVRFTIENQGKDLHVDMVSGWESGGAHSFGGKNMRSILKQIKEQFPEAEKLYGWRISSARAKAREEAGRKGTKAGIGAEENAFIKLR